MRKATASTVLAPIERDEPDLARNRAKKIFGAVQRYSDREGTAYSRAGLSRGDVNDNGFSRASGGSVFH
jgi:hypothetical protein